MKVYPTIKSVQSRGQEWENLVWNCKGVSVYDKGKFTNYPSVNNNQYLIGIKPMENYGLMQVRKTE
jgi:hypothetical protein